MTNKNLPYNLKDLIEQFDKKENLKYLLFWGHQKPKNNIVNQSCLSQWYESPFTIDSIEYKTAEHFMMASKARLFNDLDILDAIINSENPKSAKALGRKIKNFNESVWIENRFDIVVQANCAKFSQNKDLGDYLLTTGNKILVEASPYDKIWGIGLSATDPKSSNPHFWNGLNLLGFALMLARDFLEEND